MRPCAHTRERRIVTGRTHAVAQKDIDHVILGVNPEASARETSVTKGFGSGLVASA